MSELFALLLQRDRQGVLALADYIEATDWWDDHGLGHEGVTTLDHIQHWASRLKVVASVAKCLLGERCLEFFRFRGLSSVGQTDLYPFAILLRALPVERREELVRRAQNWPDPLAEQVACIDIKQYTIN